jgi:adenylate kinase family enzyme
MDAIPPLESFGRRLMILGPTNSGKSTLAVAIGAKLGIPVVHLDQFRHLPNSDWQERPQVEFKALHDAAISEPAWVMDGSYSILMPQRLARATGIIVLDDHFLRRLWRYLKRSSVQTHRAGALEGNRDSIKWGMIHWIWTTRRAGEIARQRAAASGLPYLTCHSMREVQGLYTAWHL